MTTAIATNISSQLESVLIQGDLGKLAPEQRVQYYKALCDSLGLNPLTKPFAYITLNGKLILYALKDCTEQLRNKQGISLTIPTREILEGVYVVTARAQTPSGRLDESTGAVPIEGTKGEARANAMMKAETKAKRRVTLSICGLGMLDESEVSSIPDAKYANLQADAASIDTGGHPVGTKEAAKAVLDRKLAEPEPNQFNRAEDTRHDVEWEDLESGIQPTPAATIPPPDAVVDLWTELDNRQGFDRLKLFEELKKSYGE